MGVGVLGHIYYTHNTYSFNPNGSRRVESYTQTILIPLTQMGVGVLGQIYKQYLFL